MKDIVWSFHFVINRKVALTLADTQGNATGHIHLKGHVYHELTKSG